jgi:hypothetical protein
MNTNEETGEACVLFVFCLRVYSCALVFKSASSERNVRLGARESWNGEGA